jgi:beta-lactamase superfamily II metal-dependent hydrolase
MAWELEIHIIDVGQGDSSLIIATDTKQNLHRTMLIDGGRRNRAPDVHDYVQRHLKRLGIPLDHVVVSHFDQDHSDGIVGLLEADNWYALAKAIAAPAAWWFAKGNSDAQSVAYAACAAMSVMLGAYKMGGHDEGYQIGGAIKKIPAKLSSVDAIQTGIDAAKSAIKRYQPTLLTPTKRTQIAKAAAKAALSANHVNVEDAVFAEVYDAINVPNDVMFYTGGLYANVNVIDIGDPKKGNYDKVVGGEVYWSGTATWCKVPGIARRRVTVHQPDLGREILWGLDKAAPPAQADAPAVFLVACDSRIWNYAGSIPINDNNIGIALILRFNNFFYYTGGDMETEGEDIIAQQVMSKGLPDPKNTNKRLPVPQRIACIKCGHHGAKYSTSATFLQLTKPKAAFISCGHEYTHPEPELITRLYKSTDLQYFYLTNCVPRAGIPASNNKPQLNAAGNKSRVAGGRPLLADGRDPGNIVIMVWELDTIGKGEPLEFQVYYQEGDMQPFPNGHLAVGSRTESTKF